MSELRFYLSIFFRRLPLFLPVALVVSAAAVIVAFSLPPAYESEMQLVVESPRIPDELAPSTVRIPPMEQLQIIRQRLLTRSNMLEIARKLEVLPNLQAMNPDEIVNAMRARTDIRTSSKRGEATLMWLSFEAGNPRTAAAVLSEYLVLIQREDAQFRQSRAGETLEFFQSQADQLSLDSDALSAQILAYKNEHSDALPETLSFRMNRQSTLQNQLNQINRDINALTDQRQRLITIFEATGSLATQTPAAAKTPEQRQLDALNAELNQALITYSETAPQVTRLKAQIAQLEEQIAAQTGVVSDPGTETTVTVLDIQLAEIDSRTAVLEQQREAVSGQLDEVSDAIERSPEVSIRLEELNRQYSNVRQQLKIAQERLATARTGELIETRSRGQEISVIEPPAVPSEPTKPNRMLIAAGGVALGIGAGLALILLIELLKNSVRRPEDLVKRFDIMPIASIPFIRTRRQITMQRLARVTVLLILLLGTPAAVWAIHTYYYPLDLLADRVMNKLGVRL